MTPLQRYRAACDKLIDQYNRAQVSRAELERKMEALKKLYGQDK